MTVRGGGHNVAALAVREDALMLDLGLLNRVEVEARRASRAWAAVRCGRTRRRNRMAWPPPAASCPPPAWAATRVTADN
ncbi:hypothetical protein ABQJ54_00135 [Rhodanobacter sp. Si-c]|uniref:Uncharacterized protein n=1 Tax=Rhodanobacter lycopersici TaxID=3162487 RepID=A0ABV3Q9A5_9GAMM